MYIGEVEKKKEDVRMARGGFIMDLSEMGGVQYR